MAYVQPGELKYGITIKNPVRTKDENDHYILSPLMPELIQARAGIMRSSGGDRIDDGAARSVDTITFIVRWSVRNKIQRDATIKYHDVEYAVDWMDSAPWAGQYARVRAISYDEGEM